MSDRPDIVILMTDEERAIPPYEAPEVFAWRDRTLPGRKWFDEHGVSFQRHYTGSLACVPSRPERNEPWPYVSRRPVASRPGLVRRGYDMLRSRVNK